MTASHIARPLRHLFALALASLAAAYAPQALAQATLDQTKALAGNVTPGDTAGFPITISQPGSYKLMSNLYVPAETTGIKVTADNVSIDLNGFSIIGPVTCSQDAATYGVTCNATGIYGLGIDARSTRGLNVKNGAVQGFSWAGVLFGSGVVEHLRVSHNTIGIQTDDSINAVVVAHCSAVLNQYGLEVTGGTVSHCNASQNDTAFSGVANAMFTLSGASKNKRVFGGYPAAFGTSAYGNKGLGTVRSMGNNINQNTTY